MIRRLAMPLRGTRAGAALALALLLGACATQRGPGGAGPGCALDYGGRISVVEQGPQPHNLYGSFELRLSGQRGSLELASPLGQVLARASWDADSASVDDGHARRAFGSFEDMTQATLGLRLPRQALGDWVRGRPARQLPWRERGQSGFEQLGWQVRMVLRDGVPHILRLTRVAGDTTEQLSLVIDRRASVGADCRPAAAASAAAQRAPESTS